MNSPLTYRYLLDNGKLLRNRLYHVNDAIAGATYLGDLEDQGLYIDTSHFAIENHNNYKYDAEGRLIQDLAEGIQEIVWRVDGKVKAVLFDAISEKNHLFFDYDAFGRRIAKHVATNDFVLIKSTYYILDAQGNQLLTYEHVNDSTAPYELVERVIYGSSRLGINTNKVDMLDEDPEEIISLGLGNKLYEMSNHLGNVLTVINDIKIPQSSNSVDVDGYLATIVSTADYSPFGVQLDERTESAEKYRFGYQGSEKDDEVKGSGNSYTTEFRMLDPRLGRWLSLDPMSDKYPELSPYISMENNPISLNDPFGDDPPKEQGFFKSAGRWLIGNSYITKAKNFAHKNGIDESNIDINRSLKVAVVSHISTDVKVGINEFGADITEFVMNDVVTVFIGNKDYSIIDPEVNFDTPVSFDENYKYYTREKTIDDYTSDGGFNWEGWEKGFALWKGGYGPDIGRGTGVKLTIRGIKKALREVHKQVGSLPKFKKGKWGSSQRGDGTKGYRLDKEGHPNSTNPNEKGPHINWWDFTKGKRKTPKGRQGAEPID